MDKQTDGMIDTDEYITSLAEVIMWLACFVSSTT